MLKTPTRDVFGVVADFLASEPSHEQLLAYKLPEDLQTRLSYLLYQNREDCLSYDEEVELNDLIRADNLMSLLKTKTRLKQRGLG